MRNIIFLLLIIFVQAAKAVDNEKLVNRVFGALSTEKFSFHETTYFVFGDEDLKLQYSFKYRLSKNYNLYLAYTQLMFWSIYDKSKPFKDVNYRPEIFYRIIDTQNKFLKNVDVGAWHHSNGKAEGDSRSLDEIFIRTTFLAKYRRHLIGSVLRIYNIYNEEQSNKEIVNHLGYWELNAFLTDIVITRGNNLDLNLRTYAGSKIYNFDQGAVEFGAVYNFMHSDINPGIYLQWFYGYAENLQEFDKKKSELRLGFLLSF